MLLPGTGIAAGFVLAERIRAAVAEEPFELPERRRGCPSRSRSASLSTALRSRSTTSRSSGERLLALADVALYEAKAGGRNTVARAANS